MLIKCTTLKFFASLTNSLGPKMSLKASVINKVIMFPMAFVIKEIAIITAFIDSGACKNKRYQNTSKVESENMEF